MDVALMLRGPAECGTCRLGNREVQTRCQGVGDLK
jgi:hypothetical protein